MTGAFGSFLSVSIQRMVKQYRKNANTHLSLQAINVKLRKKVSHLNRYHGGFIGTLLACLFLLLTVAYLVKKLVKRHGKWTSSFEQRCVRRKGLRLNRRDIGLIALQVHCILFAGSLQVIWRLFAVRDSCLNYSNDAMLFLSNFRNEKHALRTDRPRDGRTDPHIEI